MRSETLSRGRSIIVGCLALIGTGWLHAADFERDISPGRPDQTQGTTTLEPGHMEIEIGAWTYTRDKSGNVSDQTWSLGETNLVFGLTKNTDIEILLRPYMRDSQRGGTSSDAEGFGDIDVVGRWNLWGNDGGKTSAALVPFVTIPTQTAVSAKQWQGGLIASGSWQFADGWNLNGEGGLARFYDDGAGRHTWDFLHTVEITRDLGKDGQIYLEYVGKAGDHCYDTSLSTGLTWKIGKNCQLDLGAIWGLSKMAADFSITQGVSFRF